MAKREAEADSEELADALSDVGDSDDSLALALVGVAETVLETDASMDLSLDRLLAAAVAEALESSEFAALESELISGEEIGIGEAESEARREEDAVGEAT